jgi:two-component system, OmpR family, phosphate regulon sensor histidine kinase PhoR
MPIDKSVYDSFPDPVILLDANRHVIYANRAARDLLGCRAEGGDLSLSVRHPAVLDAVDRLSDGVQEYIVEISFPVPVPRTFELNAIHVSPRSEDNSPIVTNLLLFRDVTHTVRADQMRVDFVANVSHELRSPLAALLGFVETLKGAASDDKEASGRFLDIMEREAHRMRRLIDDLLSLSRVEANEHVRPREQIAITDCLRAALDALRLRATEHEMTIKATLGDDLPSVIGDSDQLTQVFHNLVENAIVHSNAKTQIEILIEAVARIPESGHAGICVHVRDHGAGIDKEMIPRLTERFFRADPARSRTGPTSSTGLGLAIVKHIIARHRGRLTVESELDKGSTFSVYLPSE